jgi:hypothetical protein
MAKPVKAIATAAPNSIRRAQKKSPGPIAGSIAALLLLAMRTSLDIQNSH